MSYKPGDTAFFTIPVQTANGAATNADAVPTVIVRKNGALDAVVTPTVAASGATGLYNASFVIPAGYAAGDTVAALATVVLGGVTSPPVAVFRQILDSKRLFDLNDISAASIWNTGNRTLTSFGTLVADIWANAARSLTDKSGFLLATAPPTAAQIRTELDNNSAKLDATISSRLAATSYAAPTAAPSAAANASAVRSELVTELSRIDTSVSSRSSHSALDVWLVSLGATFSPNTLGQKLKNWVLGSDNRALVSADAHTAGATVAGVTGMVGPDNAAIGRIEAKTGLIRGSVATTEDVQPTINFAPTINPTAVTVNPTTVNVPAPIVNVSGQFTQDDRDALAAKPTLDQMNDGLNIESSVDASGITVDLGNVPADVAAIRARLAEQVTEPTPVVVTPVSTIPGTANVTFDTLTITGAVMAGLPFRVEAVGNVKNASNQLGTKFLADYVYEGQTERDGKKTFPLVTSARLVEMGLIAGNYMLTYVANGVTKTKIFEVTQSGGVIGAA